MKRRTYTLKRRAETQQETRRRITEAAVDLHGTVGPARTTVAEIARRAGVQRLTVYTHFPDPTSLFAACTTHWFAQHPSPDPSSWLREREPAGAIETALRCVYDYYGQNEAMFSNWLRDAQLIPELRPFAETGYFGFIAGLRDTTLAQFGLARSMGARSAFLVALHFETWRTLTQREGLSREAAARLMAGLVMAASGS